MAKILKEKTVTKRYKEEDVYEETIIQFHYDTEKEKYEHSREMQEKGFKDSGQVRENVGNILHPDYVWFGSYYKYIKVKENTLPDMREKIKEYISELEVEIDRCHKLAEQNMEDESTNLAEMMLARVQTLMQVKNDLQGRLEELI